jgi:hypothetical protein
MYSWREMRPDMERVIRRSRSLEDESIAESRRDCVEFVVSVPASLANGDSVCGPLMIAL